MVETAAKVMDGAPRFPARRTPRKFAASKKWKADSTHCSTDGKYLCTCNALAGISQSKVNPKPMTSQYGHYFLYDFLSRDAVSKSKTKRKKDDDDKPR